MKNIIKNYFKTKNIVIIETALIKDSSPFSENIGYIENRILINPNGKDSTERLYISAIHEAGHIIFDDKIDHEYSFFGWEFLVSCYLNLVKEWSKNNYDYDAGINEVLPWNYFSLKEKKEIILERINHFKSYNNLIEDFPEIKNIDFKKSLEIL